MERRSNSNPVQSQSRAATDRASCSIAAELSSGVSVDSPMARIVYPDDDLKWVKNQGEPDERLNKDGSCYQVESADNNSDERMSSVSSTCTVGVLHDARRTACASHELD